MKNLSISESGFQTFIENEKIFQLIQTEGNNEEYICQLIRSDEVEKFISYINESNINLNGQIKPSIFETNEFLITRTPNLIEYAAFYGSNLIFKYLLSRECEMNGDIWLYGIHGKNPEIIHLIEKHRIEPKNHDYIKVIRESIKCHHYDLSKYLKNNYINDLENENEKYNENVEGIISYSYEYIPDDIENNSNLFYYLIENDYYCVIKVLLEKGILDVNKSLNIKLQIINNIIQQYKL